MKTQAFYWQTLYLSTQIPITLLFTLCSFTLTIKFCLEKRDVHYFSSFQNIVTSTVTLHILRKSKHIHGTWHGCQNPIITPRATKTLCSDPVSLGWDATFDHRSVNKHLLKTSSQHFFTIADFAPWSPHVFLDRCPCPVVPRQSQPPCVSVFTSHAKHAINITLCHFIKTSHYFPSWLTSTNTSLALRVRLKP